MEVDDVDKKVDEDDENKRESTEEYLNGSV